MLLSEPRLEITAGINFDHIIDLVSNPLHQLRQQVPQRSLYVLGCQYIRPAFSISIGIPYDSNAVWMQLPEIDKSAVKALPYQKSTVGNNKIRVNLAVTRGKVDQNPFEIFGFDCVECIGDIFSVTVIEPKFRFFEF